MNAVGSQIYVIDFNDISLKLTISALTAFSLQLAGTNTCAGVIGFDNTNTATQTSFTGTKCIEFYIDSILVKISEFFSRLYNRNMVYTFIIPIIENSNQVIQYKDGNSFTQDYFTQVLVLPFVAGVVAGVVVRVVARVVATVEDDRHPCWLVQKLEVGCV
jgi:hypothetical protein